MLLYGMAGKEKEEMMKRLALVAGCIILEGKNAVAAVTVEVDESEERKQGNRKKKHVGERKGEVVGREEGQEMELEEQRPHQTQNFVLRHQ
jgi:hypothetical protein